MINIAYPYPPECQLIEWVYDRANERQRKNKGLLFIAFIQFNLCSTNKTEWTLCTTRSKSRRQSVCRREYTQTSNKLLERTERTNEWHTFTIFISIFIAFVDEDAKTDEIDIYWCFDAIEMNSVVSPKALRSAVGISLWSISILIVFFNGFYGYWKQIYPHNSWNGQRIRG